MPKNKIIIAVIILVVLIISFFVFGEGPLKHSVCSDHYTVACYHDSEETKNVSCSSDRDCSPENMDEFCHPGYASQLKCTNARYYCGNDGYCKGCCCGFFSIFIY